MDDEIKKEEEIDAFYNRLIQIIGSVEIGSTLTEDEYIDLEDRGLLFFDAKMGAEAIQRLLVG